jgi:uncharacterized damage-inducible protein DinB
MLTGYKAWANSLIYAMLSELPYEEVIKQRQTRFGNMIHTLNHVYVIDSVFKAHLLGQEHGYTDRNTPHHPPLAELAKAVQALDRWYINFTENLKPGDLHRPVHFAFIGGGEGTMTCEEIVLHIVNHGTYHRGFVADMMYQAGVTPTATDLPVFLRRN